MITEKSNQLQVIVITDYDYPLSAKGGNSPVSLVNTDEKKLFRMSALDLSSVTLLPQLSFKLPIPDLT